MQALSGQRCATGAEARIYILDALRVAESPLFHGTALGRGFLVGAVFGVG